MFRLFVLLLVLAFPLSAHANLQECQQACIKWFPTTVTPTPVTPPPAGTKTFPHPITFERDSDQGNGAAAILFRTLADGYVTNVTVNGEVAKRGRPYKGAPVFILTLPGDQYARPLRFVIKTSDGQTWTASSGTASTPTSPVTGYSKSKTYRYFNHANGRQAWRIPENGPWFGQPVKVVFSSGKEFTVKNTSKNCRDQESNCQRNSKAKMYGFVWKSGLGENGEGDENTGTSHHGVYIHAPHGDTSTSLTIYYNK